MPYSHHSHSGEFCKHAVGTLEEVVQEAVRQGFEVYGLTEHVPRYRAKDFYPEEAGLTTNNLTQQFDSFVTEAQRLRGLYQSRIRLLIGLETEYISPLDLDGLDQLLGRHQDRIDYIVGSVHHVNEIAIDFDRETFQRCLDSLPLTASKPPTDRERTSLFLEMYFDAQLELLQRFRPEIVGHIDLCRLYTPDLKLSDFPDAWKKLDRNIRVAVEYGALFEVNAAALRKGWDTAYPGSDVIKLILRYGGHFALSDDSHGPQGVGLNYGRMRSYLLQAGVRELWTLKHSRSPNLGGRYTIPVRVEENWWDHVFWKSLNA